MSPSRSASALYLAGVRAVVAVDVAAAVGRVAVVQLELNLGHRQRHGAVDLRVVAGGGL